jgi:hypothetical protein
VRAHLMQIRLAKPWTRSNIDQVELPPPAQVLRCLVLVMPDLAPMEPVLVGRRDEGVMPAVPFSGELLRELNCHEAANSRE